MTRTNQPNVPITMFIAAYRTDGHNNIQEVCHDYTERLAENGILNYAIQFVPLDRDRVFRIEFQTETDKALAKRLFKREAEDGYKLMRSGNPFFAAFSAWRRTQRQVKAPEEIVPTPVVKGKPNEAMLALMDKIKRQSQEKKEAMVATP